MSTTIYGWISVLMVGALTTATEMAVAERMPMSVHSGSLGSTALEEPATPPAPNDPEAKKRPVRRASASPRRRPPKRGPRTRQLREMVTPPVYLGGCAGPPVPREVRRSGEEIRVRVRLVVAPDGTPSYADMEQSHPLIPDSWIIECAMSQRFEPARLPDGTPVPYPFRRQFRFYAATPEPVADKGAPTDG